MDDTVVFTCIFVVNGSLCSCEDLPVWGWETDGHLEGSQLGGEYSGLQPKFKKKKKAIVCV